MLIHLIPCNYDPDGSPSPSYIDARRSKVGLGQEKSDKNTHILTFNTVKLVTLPFSSVSSESVLNPLSK